METRRYINVKTWSETWFETLSPTEMLVWIYLNTNSATNMLGVYNISVRRLAYECHINEQTARRNIKKLEDAGKLIYSEGYVILIDWMAQQAMNPSMKIAARKEYDKLPTPILTLLSEKTHRMMKNTQQVSEQPVSPLPYSNQYPSGEKEEEEEISEQEQGTSNQKSKTSEHEQGTVEQEQDDLPTPTHETYQKAVRNKEWTSALCHNYRINETQLKEWLEHFCRKLENEGESKKSARDFRRHFAAWLKIQLNQTNYSKDHPYDNHSSHTQHLNNTNNESFPANLDFILQSEASQRIEQLRAQGILPTIPHSE